MIINDNHSVTIAKTGKVTWVGYCWCGWDTPILTSEQQANCAAAKHYEEVANEPLGREKTQ